MSKHIAFIDLEVQPQSSVVADYGGIRWDGQSIHTKTISNVRPFLSGVVYLTGHNLFRHDLRYMEDLVDQSGIRREQCIDTLVLSPLLFPKKPYHALLKDEKLQTDELNNPLNDAIKARDLFFDEVNAFQKQEDPLKQIFFLLLEDQPAFRGFFDYLDYRAEGPVAKLIGQEFSGSICSRVDLEQLIDDHPVELAYSLANIHTKDRFSIMPRWVQISYPAVDQIMTILRNRPCVEGCPYCARVLDPHRGLKRFFGFDEFRTFGGEPLQERACKAALEGKSLLAVFPTGGGKSLTFQIPALVSGESVKGLTVVISPLQSLMKDQVYNLEKTGITEAVTINGQLDPIERAVAIERVEDGSAALLYISPESLRSKTIERLLIGRKIDRVVIDEAHCFSAWGQDFRVDYLYIARFIRELETKKELTERIPVSCFTATAKPSVIEDIVTYFREQLDLDLAVIRTDVPRTNLHYAVQEKKDEGEKYDSLRNLIDARRCPTIVYVSRTKRTEELAHRLTKDGYPATAYHGKMDSRIKIRNQDAFLAGAVDIMVATSAFGMGVDKRDVGLVVHYDISDSLENYVQEAGRAGRDERIEADCYVLFCQEDLDSHFSLHSATILTMKEIQQVWSAIKGLTRFRKTISQSALEIARAAGWDETISQIENRVTAALATLEESGYLQREHNSPQIYADSILAKNGAEAYDRIRSSPVFDKNSSEQALRIMNLLIGSRQKQRGTLGEHRVDYIADSLGLPKADVIYVLNLLREIGLLGSAKDLTVYISAEDKERKASSQFNQYVAIEQFLLTQVSEEEVTYNIKELNQKAEEAGCARVSTDKIRIILNYWKIRHLVKYCNEEGANSHLRLICMRPVEKLEEIRKKREEMATFVIGYLFELSEIRPEMSDDKNVMISFSQHEIKDAYNEGCLFDHATLKDVEDVLFYLSRIGAIQIEGGFMVIYNSMVIRRTEDARRRYKKEDYQKLEHYFDQRMQQIHIVGEYARIMVIDYRLALQFVEDYFNLEYEEFLETYFKGVRKEEITRRISPRKFRELFGELSPAQLKIIKDKDSQYIGVLAGPGSGKTKVLVHKLASLFLMEDVKTDQLLMLTFSRAAATEFRLRLKKLIGAAARFVEIKTFHSYCFDLLGRVGDIEHTEHVMAEAVDHIREGDVEPSRITKTVLVIDEAQDMDQESYALIRTLMDKNEDMRVIAVGDDDQNIFEFRGSSSQYLKEFLKESGATVHELMTNYRSKNNIVEFANQFAGRIPGRLKSKPISSNTLENGLIRMIRYRSENLIQPFVEDLCRTSHGGTNCVLTCTNNEALQVAGLLLNRGIPARLIQSNEGFRLMDMVEFRTFVKLLTSSEEQPLIDEDQWNQARWMLDEKFDRSIRLENCQRVIQSFEKLHPDYKYLSDFVMTLRESKLEDFYFRARDTIFVSTIHKSKGKEFDNVHLLLNRCMLNTAEDYRKLYVAVTRAKQSLSVHLNTPLFNGIKASEMIYHEDRNTYPLPGQMAMHAGLRDVHLDYVFTRQDQINQLQCGDMLRYRDGVCLDSKGRSILRFSKRFMEEVDRAGEAGYVPWQAKVGFMVHWRKEDQEQEHVVILPELYLVREIESTGGDASNLE